MEGGFLRTQANRDFDIWKKDGWDSVALERIDEATQEGRGAEVGALILGEGTAAVCLLTEHMMVVRQRIDMPVPRKRKGQSGVHEKVRPDPAAGNAHLPADECPDLCPSFRLAGNGPLLPGVFPGCPPASAIHDTQGDRRRLARLHA